MVICVALLCEVCSDHLSGAVQRAVFVPHRLTQQTCVLLREPLRGGQHLLDGVQVNGSAWGLSLEPERDLRTFS